MGTLIDSSVLIAAERGGLDLHAAAHGDEPVAIAAGCRVATRDRRSFARIPDLEVLVL